MKKCIILVLLLAFACIGEETKPTKQPCKSMNISDANPVQFWATDCETWNESNPPGVHHYCFCQPWQCSDPIKTEFIDYNDEYFLLGYNESEELVLTKQFNGIVDTNSEGATIYFSLSDFENEDVPGGPGIAWTLGSAPNVALTPVNTSKRLALNDIANLSAGTYKIRCNVTISSSIDEANSGFAPLSFLDASDVQIAEMSISNGDNEQVVTFTDDVDRMFFRFITGSDGTGSVTINSLTITELGAKSFYSYTLYPSTEGICDEQIRLEIARQLILPELSEWTNFPSGVGVWSTGTNPSVTTDSGTNYTDALRSESPQIITPGDYTFNFDLDISPAPGLNELQLFVGLYNDAFSVGFTQQPLPASTDATGSITVNVTGIPNNIRIQLFGTNGPLTVTLNSFELSNSFEILGRSDCVDIKTAQAETLLIDYSNHTNYAGIEYGDQSPDPTFSIRIPAVFFETRFPQEGEDFQTSSNQIIALNSQVKEQRLLSTDRMPIYMHRKMALILNHQFLYIDGKYWIKGSENYEKKEKSNKRDSLDMYTCWLTRQDYVVRNIL